MHGHTSILAKPATRRLVMFGQIDSQAEALNFLNHPFIPLANKSPTATNFGQITSAVGTRTTQLRGSLEW